jgi:hypothetical protein
MVYQNDPDFDHNINAWGCYFFSLLWQLDKHFELGIMDPMSIRSIYASEQLDGDIGNECFLTDPQGICTAVIPGRVQFLGRQGFLYIHGPDEFEIQCWYNPNTNFHHFVAGDGATVLYDPIQGGSRTVREGSLESKRIFRIV